MNPFDDILARAKSDPRHIVLAEGEDTRVIDSALSAIDAGIAESTLLGREAMILEQLVERGTSDLPVRVVDPATSPLRERFAVELKQLRRHRGVDLAKARKRFRRKFHWMPGCAFSQDIVMQRGLRIAGRALDPFGRTDVFGSCG